MANEEYEKEKAERAKKNSNSGTIVLLALMVCFVAGMLFIYTYG